MAIPDLDGFSVGEKVQASKLTTHTKGAIEAAVYYKPFCSMTQSSGDTVGSSTTASKRTLNLVVEDTDGMADTANSRMVVQTAGVYRLSASLPWNTNINGHRGIEIRVNGTVVAGGTISGGPNAGGSAVNCTKTVRLSAGAVIELYGWQNSGGNLATSGVYGGVHLEAEWISK